MEHLGLLVGNRRELFLVPLDKQLALQREATCLRHVTHVVARKLAQFCGRANSISLAFPPARFFLQSLYDVLRTKRPWRDHLHLTPQVKEDLAAWAHLARWNGRALAEDRIPSLGTLATDASLTGWGATYQPSKSPALLLARGFWNRTMEHINVRELQAIHRAIVSFGSRITPPRKGPWRRLLVQLDSQVAFFALLNMCSPSGPVMRELRILFQLCQARQLLLQPTWIPSQANVIPDQLSRLNNTDDYMLAPSLFRRLERLFGTRTIDRFATASNTQLPRFNSWIYDVGTEGLNAFNHDWTGERNWANPPWSQLPRLTRFLEDRPRVECLVLAPEWPQAPWYGRLLRIATQTHLLRRQPGMFAPGHPGLPATLRAPRWDLRAFHVTPRPTSPPVPIPHLRTLAPRVSAPHHHRRHPPPPQVTPRITPCPPLRPPTRPPRTSLWTKTTPCRG